MDLRRLSATARWRIVTGCLVAVLGAAAIACGGDSDEGTGSTARGAIATSTPVAEATAAPSRTPIGSLSSASTPTVAASPSAAGLISESDEAELYDLMPCSSGTYHEVVNFDQVPTLAYSKVPEGTPILFPFEEGDLRLVDAREGAITFVYDIPDVGVLSIHAAGSTTLDRTVGIVGAGTVIGHFGESFGDDEPDAFEGYQLLVAIRTSELLRIGEQLYAGESLQPVITDCLILP